MNSKAPEPLPEALDLQRLPDHVAIIMDGNGRWAKQHLLNRIKGHEKGADTVRRIVRTSREIGIPVLTLYAFSTENWERPKTEVAALMQLLKRFLRKERATMLENDICLSAIGQTERLPSEVRNELDAVKAATASNTGMRLNLALSYGGRQELVRMTRTLAAQVAAGRLTPDAIDEDTVSAHLYTAGLPDPDLMIRTSGEMRLSNYLLWQLAYAELYVTNTLWPEFSRKEYLDILVAYQQRDRRFGRVRA
ncbi:MAG: isoprenyl transferase [Desulfosarcinaceae bacterium]|nr:isoprenyl transferase [Desulfosarcinaceae bacterium]